MGLASQRYSHRDSLCTNMHVQPTTITEKLGLQHLQRKRDFIFAQDAVTQIYLYIANSSLLMLWISYRALWPLPLWQTHTCDTAEFYSNSELIEIIVKIPYASTLVLHDIFKSVILYLWCRQNKRYQYFIWWCSSCCMTVSTQSVKPIIACASLSNNITLKVQYETIR